MRLESDCKKKKHDPGPTYEDLLKHGEPNENGLFCDSANDYVTEVQPDIRPLHENTRVERHELFKSGLEYAAAIVPEIVRLEEKDVAHRTYKEVLALAGIAKTNQKTTFDIIEETISDMRKQAEILLGKAKKLEEQLIYLKNLAVLDN